MQLAKIRNKAAQERAVESLAHTGGGSGHDQPPRQELPVSIPLSEVEVSLPSTPPVVQGDTLQSYCRPAVFDPLAIILSGREQLQQGLEGLPLENEENTPELSVPDSSFAEFLCFRLGDEEYGVNILEIKEIIKPRTLTEVPRTVPYIEGVISLRGVIVPIFNMRKRIRLSSEYVQHQERIIIVRLADELYGLQVDRVTDVVRIADDDREPAPAMLEGGVRDFVAGIGHSGERMVILLDIARVVDTTQGEA